MKRLLMMIVAMLLGVASLAAQGEQYKELGKKYDRRKGYEVVSVGRAAIRMAALTSDKAGRELMRKIDLLVSVSHKGSNKGPLRGDFDQVVRGYNSVGQFRNDTTEAHLFMNPERTGFAMYSLTPSGEAVLLLAGRELDLAELLPKELRLK